MNLLKIKLALTVDLINTPNSENPLNSAKSLMKKHQSEAGDFVGSALKDKTRLNENLEKSIHELKFDHCTLDLELISDSRASKSLIQSFELHKN